VGLGISSILIETEKFFTKITKGTRIVWKIVSVKNSKTSTVVKLCRLPFIYEKNVLWTWSNRRCLRLVNRNTYFTNLISHVDCRDHISSLPSGQILPGTSSFGNNQRLAPTTTLRALNRFSETLYEECSYNCVQTWYCTVHFVCTGNCLPQKLDFTWTNYEYIWDCWESDAF
jgi:hypothetical protein